MSNSKSKPKANTMDALHSKCQNTPCTGPGCRRSRTYNYSTAAPRIRTRLTKPERRLEARIAGWESKLPLSTPQHGQEMHKPGSQSK